MALAKRDYKSGGLVFHRSQDEKKSLSIIRENEILKTELQEMKQKMLEIEDLKRIVEELQKTIKKKK